MNDTHPDILARIAAHYASLTPVGRMYGTELPEAALLAHARHPAGDWRPPSSRLTSRKDAS